MYPVSEDYISAMRRPVQRHRLTGTVGEVTFADEDILSGSFSITGQCSENGNVQIGQVYIGELKMTFLSKDKLSRYSLKGTEITPYFGLRIESGSYEFIPLGVFTVQEASWGVSGVAITAYDHLAKLDRSFSGSKLHGTPFTLLTLACTNCGVELGMLRDEFEDFSNGTAVLQIYEDNDCETWRDIVSWIAQTLGANVFADREGKIVLRKYGREVVDTVDDYHRLSGATFGDYETCYTGLSCVNIEEQTTSYYGEEEDTGLTYNLGMNPFLQYATSGTVDEMRRSILTALGEILYVPFRVDVIGNPAYDLMDVIRFTDGIADGEKLSCITKYQFRYGDRFSFQGDGQNPALASQNSKSDKKIAGLMSQIESITSSINRLIYDYNTGPLEVSQYEMTVGMITFYISEQADVEGHFLMRYEASNPTRITLRFYDTQVEELYSPLIMEVQEGKGVIGIPHAYLHREVGIHAVYVTVQCTIGELSIPTRGVFYSIDAGNFATAIDEIPMDIRDITMRQLLESNGPDEIWTIGLEKGEAYVSKRPYSTSPNARVGWEGVLALGKAVDAAIEFDGTWVYRVSEQQYTLETEDQPWYFWTTEEGTLYAQHGEDADGKEILDTGVKSVSACRGYSSALYPDHDQGLVVAYVKDGKPWYRQYAYVEALDGKDWLDPVLLIDEEAESIRVSRLNDYRLSFTTSTDEKNLWFYTERTYVGNAVPSELIDLPYEAKGGTFCYMPDGLDEELRLTDFIVSEDRLILTLLLDKQLVYRTSDISDRELVTFSSGIEDKNVKSITVTPENGMTEIVVELKSRSKTLITEVYVNAALYPQLHMLLDGRYEVICLQSVTASYDNTVYTTAETKDTVALPAYTQHGFDYIDIALPVKEVSDQVNMPTHDALNYRYLSISMPVQTLTEVTAMPLSDAMGFDYIQTGTEPI